MTRGWFILGPELDAFEAEFATACGAPYAVGVGTGTDALAIALRALGIGPGDEVITSPLSAAYSALAIMMAGARPVFADIDADRLTLDPHAAAAAVTSRTAAIMPVHLYGQAADMRAIAEVARRHNLAIVEDCCQAHLATCDGRPVGSDRRRRRLQLLSDQESRRPGRRRRVDDARCGARWRERSGCATAARPTGTGTTSSASTRGSTRCRRRSCAPACRSSAGGPSGGACSRAVIATPWTESIRSSSRRSSTPVTSITSSRCAAQARDAMQAHLRAAGIETLIHYPIPIPHQPALATEHPAECPIATRVCAEVFSLPLYPSLADAAIGEVATALATSPRGAHADIRQHEPRTTNR